MDKLTKKMESEHGQSMSHEGLLGLAKDFARPKTSKEDMKITRASDLQDALMRAGMLGIGTSALVNYAPVVGASFGKTLYHGTEAANLSNILATGLKTQYAGQAKRINSLMLTNAIMQNLRDVLKRDLTIPEREAILDIYRKHKVGSGGVADKLISKAEDLARANKLSGSKLKLLRKNLSNRGKRLYFGYAPHTVTDWASSQNEVSIGMKNIKEKFNMDQSAFTKKINEGKTPFMRFLKKRPKLQGIFGKAFAIKSPSLETMDVMTGGYGSNIKELITDPRRFKKAIKGANVGQMTLESARKYIQSKGYDVSKDYGVVIGVTPSVKELKNIKSFSDFPVVGHLMSANTGLRNIVKRFLPNYSPGRDISVANDIAAKNIKDIIVINKSTNKIKDVIKIQSPGTKKSLFKNLKKIKTINPTALIGTLGGAALVGGALFGSNWYRNWRKKNKKSNILKTASVQFSTIHALKQALKFGGGTAVGGAAVAIPYYLMDKTLRKEKSDIVTRSAINKLTQEVGGQAAQGGIFAKTVKDVFSGTNDSLGLALKANVGVSDASLGFASQGAQTGSPQEAYVTKRMGTETLPLGFLLPEKVDKEIKRKSSIISLLKGIAIPAVAAGSTAFVYNKYYPAVAHINKNIKGEVKGTLDFLYGNSKNMKKNFLISAGIGALIPLGVSLLAWRNAKRINKKIKSIASKSKEIKKVDKKG